MKKALNKLRAVPESAGVAMIVGAFSIGSPGLLLVGWMLLLIGSFLLKRSTAEIYFFANVDLLIGYSVTWLIAIVASTPFSMIVFYALVTVCLLLLLPVSMLYYYTKSINKE